VNYLAFIFILFFSFSAEKVLAQLSPKNVDIANDSLLKFDAPIVDGYITFDLGSRSDFASFDVPVGITNISKYTLQVPASIVVWNDGRIENEGFGFITLLPNQKIKIPLHVHPVESKKKMYKSGGISVEINKQVLYYRIQLKVDFL
jgi:hypothetical protein